MREALLDLDADVEDPDYLGRQLITYLGNKRSLLGLIEKSIWHARRRLGSRRIVAADLFSGSGVVSRRLKQHAHTLYSNDFEAYAAVCARAHLANRSTVDLAEVSVAVDRLNSLVGQGRGPAGFIREMYAPSSEEDIREGDRVFYTVENARRLDAFAQLIRAEDPRLHDLLLAPLLSRASMHANTGGVFKGFYKDGATGLGKYGGRGSDALNRIRARIELEVPLLSHFDSEVHVYQTDAHLLAPRLHDLDFAYLDPPYNQHPYGSNYFMLNLLVDYLRPSAVSAVSGIPEGWNRSAFNSRATAGVQLREMIIELDAKFIALSMSDDGFHKIDEIVDGLSGLGVWSVSSKEHPVFRAARTLRRREASVSEYVLLLEKG